MSNGAPTQFPKFAEQYIIRDDVNGITLTEEGQEWVDMAIRLTADIKWASENPPIDFNFFGHRVKVDYPLVAGAEKFIDDMAYAIASRTGKEAPAFASVESVMSAMSGQTEQQWLEGENLETGEKNTITTGTRPHSTSKGEFDLLHAYLYQDGIHRKNLRPSNYIPTSWTKGSGEGWKSLVRTPGIDHGVYFSIPSGKHTEDIIAEEAYWNSDAGFKGEGPDMFFSFQTALDANSGFKSVYRHSTTDTGLELTYSGSGELNDWFSDIFKDDTGSYTKRDFKELKRNAVINEDDSFPRHWKEIDYTQMTDVHDQVYEILYNVTNSGLAQSIQGQVPTDWSYLGGNIGGYHHDPFLLSGLASFKVDANLAHYSKSIGYDQEQDAYYFSTADVWDFGSNHSDIWGVGSDFQDVRDQDRYYFDTIGGEKFIFDLLDTKQISEELQKLDAKFGDGVVHDTESNINDLISDLKRQNKDQWQADFMEATGNAMHLYDRIYIPKEVMNEWLKFYGIEEGSAEQKDKWIRGNKKLTNLMNHPNWNKIPNKRKREAIQLYSFYENDPKLEKTGFSHLNLIGVAPELFDNEKSRYVEIEGDGVWQNKRTQYLYDTKNKNLIYWDNASMVDGELVKSEQFGSLYDLHNSVIGE